MSDIGKLALQAFKNLRAPMIAFAIVFGLDIKDFFTPLWNTGDVGASWANWLTKAVPEIPVLFLILTILYVVLAATEVGRKSQEDTYSDRDDGYRSPRHD